MIGRKVIYETPGERFSRSHGIILDKIEDKGSWYYLIQKSGSTIIDKVRCIEILEIVEY